MSVFRYIFIRCIWLTLGLAATGLWGQEARPEELNIRQGLSQGFISSLLQDQEGFIWAGTKNGLNRYDGRRFRVFTTDPANPYAISHDYVSALWEHGDILLVGTNGGGLNFYHKKTQQFYRMPDSLPGGRLETPGILKVAVDAQGNIWLVNWVTYLEGLLYHIVLPPGFWERLPTGENRWEGVSIVQYSDQLLNRFYLSLDGKRLYYHPDSVLVEINTQTLTERRYPHPLINKHTSLQESASGTIYLSYKNHLLALEAGNWTVFPANFTIYGLHDLQAGNRMLFRSGSGKLFYLPVDKKRPLLREEDGTIVATDKKINLVLVDRSGNIWYGTNGFGMYRINPKLGRFRTYFKDQSVYSPPIATEDGSFIYFSDQTLNKIGNLVTSDPSSRHPLVARQNLLPRIGAHGRYVADAAGNSWILFVYNYNQSALLHLRPGGSYQVLPTPENESRPGNIALGTDGKIWIGLNGRFYRFDPATQKFSNFDYRSVLPSGHDVRALTKTPDGRWWIGTSLGLVEAKPTGTAFDFRLWKTEPGNSNSLRNEDIACLLNDPANARMLWIGTKGGGLHHFDTQTGRFAAITTKNGLPDNVVYGVLPDHDGHLWLSTNRGLARFHPASGAIKNFTEDDGLQGDEFNTWAYGKTPSGELMFGGVQGLNVFDPKDFDDNPNVPAVFLTGLKINNRNIAPGDSTGLLQNAPEFTQSLRLPFHLNSVSFEFAALEFTTPAKNRFRYYLEGAEPEWAHESDVPSAQYLNLAPGKYTFKVMACNNDGVWNPVPATLKITILPPWYRRWWAYTFYALLAAALAYTVMQLRLRQLQLRQNLALEHREAERIRELDQFKSRLFTNITHEFRTPLTVILGVTEQLEKQAPDKSFADLPAANTFAEGLKKRLALVRRNGRSLLDLVNQLLDLAKAESNQLKIDLVQGDVVRYVRYITESFHSLANHSNVLLRVESSLPELVMHYDPEKLRQILSNLISNALKFTPSGGRVEVRIDLPRFENQEGLVIQVADTGAGIPPEDLPRVFDRFYQADNSVSKAGGTGIGLALTKELVKLLGGDIAVESTLGKGAVFTVVLPAPPSPQKGGDSVAYAEGPTTPNLLTEATSYATPPPPLEGQQGVVLPSILIIEDNPDVVEYLAICLSASNLLPTKPPANQPNKYQLDFAYNGRAGIERALETVPDLILSDVMMPEKDGFEVCDTLKNDARTSHIPIVLLTAKADVESRIAGLRRGADAYLAKPFHPEELLVTIEKLLENRRRLQERYSSLSLDVPAPAIESAKPNTDTGPEDAFLEKLRHAVEARLGDADLAADDLLKNLGMSRSNLYSKLSALTGMSFNIYVRKLRLNKAKHLLQTTEMNVSEVAFEVGFNDPKYFSRVFAEAFGMPPSGFRPTNPA